MFLFDWIWVCSFSMTSPSWIRSCLTLIPVISANARASWRDSYSWVVIVSETTLISMPRYGSAARVNQDSSASCWSLLSVLGLNWLTHLRAAAFPCSVVKLLLGRSSEPPPVHPASTRLAATAPTTALLAPSHRRL